MKPQEFIYKNKEVILVISIATVFLVTIILVGKCNRGHDEELRKNKKSNIETSYENRKDTTVNNEFPGLESKSTEIQLSTYSDYQDEKKYISDVKKMLMNNLNELESKYKTLSAADFTKYLSNWNRNANTIKLQYHKPDFNCFTAFDYNRMLSSYQQAGLEFIKVFDNRNQNDYYKFKQRINESYNLLMDTYNSKNDRHKEIDFNESLNKEKDRMIVIWANKYNDGNISYSIGIYYLNQQCAWIPGILTLKIYDDNDNLLKTKKQKITYKDPESCEQFEEYFNVYLGNLISRAKYMKAIYNAENGQQYNQDYIFLKWAL